jgi:hypothetical protein
MNKTRVTIYLTCSEITPSCVFDDEILKEFKKSVESYDVTRIDIKTGHQLDYTIRTEFICCISYESVHESD